MNDHDAYYEEIRALVKRIHAEGKEDDIFAGLTHKGALMRLNAIWGAVECSIKTPEIVELIKDLRNDNITLMGYSVSDFATAALDVLDVEKYTGDDEQVIRLIDSRFDF